MKNVAESFSNYPAFRHHFGELVIEKVGKDDYIAARPGEDTWENRIQRGTKEYINGWLYGAVQRECGQIGKTKEQLEPGQASGHEHTQDPDVTCPGCGATIEVSIGGYLENGEPWDFCPLCGSPLKGWEELVMKEFTINIKETLEMRVTVEAENLEAALAEVERNWENGDYVLDAEHFTGVDFSEAEE